MGLVWTTTCIRLKSTRYKDLRSRLPCLEAPNLPPPLKGFIHLLVRVRSTPVVDPREGLCGCPLHHHRVASETPNPKFRHRRNFVARNRFPVYTAAVSFFLISRNFPRCCCRYRTTRNNWSSIYRHGRRIVPSSPLPWLLGALTDCSSPLISSIFESRSDCILRRPEARDPVADAEEWIGACKKQKNRNRREAKRWGRRFGSSSIPFLAIRRCEYVLVFFLSSLLHASFFLLFSFVIRPSLCPSSAFFFPHEGKRAANE